jgi:integrase
MGSKSIGRRAGGHNRGFWYRKNRGWYTTQEGATNIPLCAETGEHLTTPEQEAEAEKAYARWLLSDKPTKQGRRAGGSNKGYWYRKNRGWFTTEGQRKVPLLDKAGNHIKDPQTPDDLLKDAYARYRLGLQERMKREAAGDTALVGGICEDYLVYAKGNNRPSTFEKRGEYLFDFCHGLPAKFWDYGRGRRVQKPTAADYIHDGYGNRTVGQLIPMDVQRWLDKHPGWGKGTRRIAVQGLKRAFNYALAMGLITKNPIRGFKVGVGGKRVTFFTPEMESELCKSSFTALATAIQVCIRTGARYGSEFAKLTARHVEETPKGMLWRFSPDESKNHKPRTIYVAHDIAEIVRPLLNRYPTGPLFRNRRGQPWTNDAMRRAFLRLRDRLAEKKIKLDDDACLYTCRHTFAKRTLGGYWTGKPVTIEVLAGLMGNTRQVCWEHYAKWCDNYTEPLWEAVGR